MTAPDPLALTAARATLRAAEGPLRMRLRPDPGQPDNPARCAWCCDGCDCPEAAGGLSVVRLAAPDVTFPCPRRGKSDASPADLAACERISAGIKRRARA